MDKSLQFYNIDGVRIGKSEASSTVLSIYDKEGKKLNRFVNYHACPLATLIKLDAFRVALYTNHAGNNACTLALRFNPTTGEKVKALNLSLANR